MLRQDVTNFADRAVLVVGQRLDDDRRAAGTVALVIDLLVRDARQLARAALNRALDVVGGHVDGLGFGHDRAQARIAVDVATAAARRDGQFLDDPREDLAALGVGSPLLVLNRVPFGMAGHDETPENSAELTAHLTTSHPFPVSSSQFSLSSSLGTLGTANWRPETSRSYSFRRQDDPDIRARIPGASLVVTEHGQHAESRPLEPARQLRHREGAKGQGKPDTPGAHLPFARDTPDRRSSAGVRDPDARSRPA